MKKSTGAVGIIFGLLFLSLEIYGLRVLQALDKVHGSWGVNVWGYACEPPCALALILTAISILFSLYIFLANKDS